jgi:type IV pilus assembly protein PilW
MVVGTADSIATYSNWRRVRSLRIGLVLRGARNSALSRTTNISKLCALGVNPDVPADCVDESGSENPHMGSEFPTAGSTIANDGRLRQTLTFTVFLRNVQNQ